MSEDMDKKLAAITMEIANRAKINCPVDKGALRNSIKWKKIGPMVYQISVDEPYAEYVEFGTAKMEAAHGKHDPNNPVKSWKAKTKRGGPPTQIMPFLRPALLSVKGELEKLGVRMEVG